MKIDLIDFPSKTWGIIPLPNIIDHFHTGYENEWNGAQRWDIFRQHGVPKEKMQIGTNAIIHGLFHIDGYSRGRSAANFHGHFKDHDAVKYDLSMDGANSLWQYIQHGDFPLRDGYFYGQFTFVKNGQNIFLKPFL